MQRLKRLETYLEQRHGNALDQTPSIFSDPSKTAFGTVYCRRSETHQALKSRIEQEVNEKKEEKKRE